MQGSRKQLWTALALLAVGIAAFFLFLFVTGHDPDERPLALFEWVIAGMLVGPGVGYLVRWIKLRDQWRTPR
jgi:multisubunit Na+/H+ antiporter MnhB subunit